MLDCAEQRAPVIGEFRTADLAFGRSAEKLPEMTAVSAFGGHRMDRVVGAADINRPGLPIGCNP
jgi:hypothetical protein